ncbi:DUF3800 domain-containing protein [Pseudomonas sp. MWU13-3659]|uniref:DUF3800 domain-containing protein n=1 Tax=Pseudomonas sp. MWU13-3659 TaxID=2986964 RepID=UPI002074ADE3|nr:DUF3800 domain-containing protein [Pseudomonas sp. MWU13-3659]
MYFYVDESGQTGLNLFDPQQPVLYYGVLSSPYDLNEAAKDSVQELRKRFGVERLHSNELGVGRLTSVALELSALQRDLDLTFDIYRVDKADHALICFFDQVFDQGLNKAVPWTAYWTPLRYVVLAKLAYLFDEDLLKLAWKARIEKNSARANAMLQQICEVLLSRVDNLPDPRSREIIGDALKWANRHPEEIHYNIYGNEDKLQISPNLIGFQSVMHGIALRLKIGEGKAAAIVVDRQGEFNKAQEYIADFYRSAKEKNVPWEIGPGLPKMDLSNIPDVPITCTPGDMDAGLELVDIYLWLMKRVIEKKDVSPELLEFIAPQFEKGMTDEVSFAGIMRRWEPVIMNLPEPSPEERRKWREVLTRHEEYRKQHLNGI